MNGHMGGSALAVTSALVLLLGCGGGDAPAPLVRVDEEPPGANCAAGGQAVREGADTNRNGTLDDAEVTATRYVCVARELTRVDDEPAGAHCLGGGAAVRTGTDADGDGVLEDAEVKSVQYVCDQVVHGDVAVLEQADLDALAKVQAITGSLTFYDAQVAQVSLPELRVVGGALLVHGELSRIERVDLPALERVGEGVEVNGQRALKELRLPALVTAPFGIQVIACRELITLTLDALMRLESLALVTVPKLSELKAGALVSLGELNVNAAGPLALELPMLQSLGGLAVLDSQVTAVRFPLLYGIDGLAYLHGLPALATLELPQLEGLDGGLILEHAAALTELSLPRLRRLHSAIVRDNAALASVSLPVLPRSNGDLGFARCPQLASVSAPQLAAVDARLIFQVLPALTSLEGVSQVQTVGQYLLVTQTGVTRLALPQLTEAGHVYVGTLDAPSVALAAVDLPRLHTTGGLVLYSLPELTTLSLPALREVTGRWWGTNAPPAWFGVDVADARRLPACRVDALLAQLAYRPERVSVSGVDTEATCD